MQNNEFDIEDEELDDLDEQEDVNRQSKFKKSLPIVIALLVIVIVVGLVFYFSFTLTAKKPKAVETNRMNAMAKFPEYEAPKPEPPPPPPATNVNSLNGMLANADKKKEMTWQERRNQGSMAVFSGGDIGNGFMPTTGIKPDEIKLDRQGFPVSNEEKSELAASLTPTKVDMVQATILPNRHYLLTRGTAIDCGIREAMDNRMAGFLKCIVARDVYSESGKLVLVPRGSELDGEMRSSGSATPGQVRIAVLWNRIKTPKGVVVDINSPASDALGRGGVVGDIDNHFWERFGASLAFSVFDTVWNGVSNRLIPNLGSGSGTTNNFGGGFGGGGGGKAIVDAMLRQYMNIPPSIVSNQGNRIMVILAGDIDFSSVYRLSVLP